MVADRDPLDAVLELGRNASRIAAFAMLGAVLLHGAAITRAALIPMDLMHWGQLVGRAVHEKLYSVYEVDLVKAPELPPAPPEPPAPKEEPKEPPPPAPVKTTAPAAAPAAALAGAVLTAPPDPNEPVSFDGEFITMKDGLIGLRPYTPGGPPIWIAGAEPEATSKFVRARYKMPEGRGLAPSEPICTLPTVALNVSKPERSSVAFNAPPLFALPWRTIRFAPALLTMSAPPVPVIVS